MSVFNFKYSSIIQVWCSEQTFYHLKHLLKISKIREIRTYSHHKICEVPLSKNEQILKESNGNAFE